MNSCFKCLVLTNLIISGSAFTSSTSVPATPSLPGSHTKQEAFFQCYPKMAMQQTNTPQKSDVTEEESLTQEGSEESVEEKRSTTRNPLPGQSKCLCPTPLWRSTRSNKGTHPRTYTNHIATVTVGDDSAAAANVMADVTEALGVSLGKPGTDPSPFLPDPRSLQASLRAPLHAQPAWGKALKKETKGLICDMKVFEMVKDVSRYWKVIPLMLALKCKIDTHGLINELKGRTVFRGNLCTPEGGMDLWNPHATDDQLKLFLGC